MRKGALIAIIIIAVVVVGAVVGIIVYNNSQSSGDGGGITNSQSSGESSGIIIGGNTGNSGSGLGFEEDQSNIVRSSDPTVCIPGYDKVYIDANKTTVYMDLENPSENEGLFYLTYELRLADTGEVLYTSGLIRPGESVREIELTRALAPGTYKAVLHVQPYTADEYVTPTYNTDLNFDLIAR